MKKRIEKYLAQLKALGDEREGDRDWEPVLKDLLIQIGFYQHERMAHLIVMVLFAILVFMSVGIAIIAEYAWFFLVAGALMVLLVPYIMHYRFLENSVQEMYEYYDLFSERSKKKV